MRVISDAHFTTLKEAKHLFLKALEEDKAHSDTTSLACIPKESYSQSYVMLKEDCCLAGLKFLPFIFHKKLEVILLKQDGQFCSKGTIVVRLFGPTRLILSVERTLINFLQHLCGIATMTKKCTDLVKEFNCDILDTRKTIPGMRHLQKYAVAQGGGKNHRLDLEEQILIKNNHLSFIEKNSTDKVQTAIELARKTFPNKRIEVEIEHPKWIEQAVLADAILLDNMEPTLIKECVEKINNRAYIEASGGITLQNLKDYAQTGVNGISMGFLTHSVKATDICLRIEI